MMSIGTTGTAIGHAALRDLLASEVATWDASGKRVLAIVPDGTRTAPMGRIFRALYDAIGRSAGRFDVLIATGTHPPMSEPAIDRRFELTPADRAGTYSKVRFYNHRWDDPRELASIGAIDEDEIAAITGGRMRERVEVTVNRRALDADLLVLVGPTFPHEVAGFSGGNKYLFPGISGPEIIDMFHWLGALITNPRIIGTKHTPVRAVIDRAASLVPVERKGVSLVVAGGELAGVYAGSVEEAWGAAADHSARVHVVRKARGFRSVLSCAPSMYDELWVGGKCVYKLEPVVADGGEIIVYAPHISRLSTVHGEVIRRIGYHVRDYFTEQAARFAGVPRGVMAHSTHVKGVGTYEGGIERPRMRVTLATGIGAAECRAVNLGYRDYRTIDVQAWKDREADGLLCVTSAGETLYRLGDREDGPWLPA